MTLVGGPHPSALPEFVLASMPTLDFSWKCEAEEGLPQLLSFYQEFGRAIPEELLETIPGLTWRSRARGACRHQSSGFFSAPRRLRVACLGTAPARQLPGFRLGRALPDDHDPRLSVPVHLLQYREAVRQETAPQERRSCDRRAAPASLPVSGKAFQHHGRRVHPGPQVCLRAVRGVDRLRPEDAFRLPPRGAPGLPDARSRQS